MMCCITFVRGGCAFLSVDYLSGVRNNKPVFVVFAFPTIPLFDGMGRISLCIFVSFLGVH